MKDLRKDFNYDEKPLQMPDGHLKRFESRLQQPKPGATYSRRIQAVAAVIVLGIFVSNLWFQESAQPTKSEAAVSKTPILEQLSPELGNLEAYLKASITYEIATLDYGDYEEVAISYLEEYENIEQDYDKLKDDLKTSGYNDIIITAMIDNLQLRLELLQNLKLKINELKNLKDENTTPQRL